MTVVARVSLINRYPVKSLAGESPDSVRLNDLGIEGDRRWALRDALTGKVISAKLPALGRKLLTWSARMDNAGPVVTIDGTDYRAADEVATNAALSKALGRPVVLESAARDGDVYESYWPEIEGLAMSDVSVDLPTAMSTNKGTYVDLAALHLLTTSSMAHLAALAPQSTIHVNRFRPSMLLDTGAAVGFVEHDWVGRRARLGSATIEFGTLSPRCVMTTLAQPGLDDDKHVLQTLATHNRHDFGGFGNFACLGIYAEVIEPGTVAVGDALELLPA